MRRLRGSLAAVLAVCMISAAFAEEIGWQEAVARLAYERTKAETCVKELKKYGDKAAISRGEDAYNDAKAEYDAIVQRLDHRAGEERRAGEPARSRSSDAAGLRRARGVLQERSAAHSVNRRATIADHGHRRRLSRARDRRDQGDLLRKQDDDALMRKTIETQLEATSWPAFASILPRPDPVAVDRRRRAPRIRRTRRSSTTGRCWRSIRERIRL